MPNHKKPLFTESVLENLIETFDDDPADSDFQEGFLAALQMIQDEFVLVSEG